MRTLLIAIVAGLAGYGFALLGERQRVVHLSDAEVERRTRPEPYGGHNVVPVASPVWGIPVDLSSGRSN